MNSFFFDNLINILKKTILKELPNNEKMESQKERIYKPIFQCKKDNS